MKARQTLTLKLKCPLPETVDARELLDYVRGTLWQDEATLGRVAPIQQERIAEALKADRASISLVQKVTDYGPEGES